MEMQLMCLFHSMLLLGLIALSLGVGLCVWDRSTFFAKLIGFIVIIVSLMSIGCTVYCGMKYWQEGRLHFHLPIPGMEMGVPLAAPGGTHPVSHDMKTAPMNAHSPSGATAPSAGGIIMNENVTPPAATATPAPSPADVGTAASPTQ